MSAGTFDPYGDKPQSSSSPRLKFSSPRGVVSGSYRPKKKKEKSEEWVGGLLVGRKREETRHTHAFIQTEPRSRTRIPSTSLVPLTHRYGDTDPVG